MSALKRSGNRALGLVEDVGLLVVGVMTVIAMGQEVWTVFLNRHVSLADLLLMFIYLEVLAMVGLYLKSGKLPVRMPLYIVIVALARYMALDMKNLETWRMLGLAGAILVVALAILVIRFGHARYPYDETDKGS
ncbi:MAG: phosphate-starvation-inducible PsiE family protein [Aeromonadaceae bacterium]|nr:phosphate-starvation-inducible PsiE family protein [Aeromonadaceae bacterium]